MGLDQSQGEGSNRNSITNEESLVERTNDDSTSSHTVSRD